MRRSTALHTTTLPLAMWKMATPAPWTKFSAAYCEKTGGSDRGTLLVLLLDMVGVVLSVGDGGGDFIERQQQLSSRRHFNDSAIDR